MERGRLCSEVVSLLTTKDTKETFRRFRFLCDFVSLVVDEFGTLPSSEIRLAETGLGIYNDDRVSDPRGLARRFSGGGGEGCAGLTGAIRGCGWKRLRLPCWKGNARWGCARLLVSFS